MSKKIVSDEMRKMVSLVIRLRGDGGCPWLKQQTFTKQLDELRGELKEVEDAVVNGDVNNLKEELGDVFWDLLLLIKISEDEYGFKMEDILKNTSQKIMRRKPYVFGDEKAETPEEAVAIWKRVKQQEKERRGN